MQINKREVEVNYWSFGFFSYFRLLQIRLEKISSISNLLHRKNKISKKKNNFLMQKIN